MQLPTLLGGASAAKPKAEQGDTLAELDFGDLLSKVEAAEAKVRSQVVAAVPEVKLQLPRLDAGSFEAAASRRAADHGAAFAAVPSAPEVPDVEMGSAAEGLLQTSDIAVANQSNKSAEAIAGLARQLRAPLLAASASLTLVVAAALAGVGAVPTAIAVAIASTSGSVCVWHARMAHARMLVTEKLEAAISCVSDVIRDSKDLILGLSDRVVATIDKMTEEQKPVLQKIQELESTLKVDVPDPSDLKRPLEGCKNSAIDLIAKVEETMPAMVNEFASMTYVGKLAIDSQLFMRVVVGLPTLAVLTLNVALTFAQLSFDAAQRAAQDAQHAARDVETATKAFELQRPNATLEAVLQPQLVVDWAAYLHPWASQMVLMLLQVAVAMLLSEASRLCALVNSMIAVVEEKANASINERIAAVVQQVCGQAFSEVSSQCDVFFPKLKDTLIKLEQAMALAGKAEALAEGADKLRSFMKW